MKDKNDFHQLIIMIYCKKIGLAYDNNNNKY
jgi:hypothetical protein